MVGPAPLSVGSVVDLLVDLDLVDFSAPGPWPGEPDATDQVCEVDWASVHGDASAPPYRGDAEKLANAPADPWSRARDRVLGAADRGFQAPPPVLDLLAWYLPMHYFGADSAIYIRESAILDIAGQILSFVDQAHRAEESVVHGSIRSALSVLYLHEAFHHKVESFAIRVEAVERRRRYLPYMEGFFIPSRDRQSDDLLEEALACAEMRLRLGEPRYRRGVPPMVCKATVAMLAAWLPHLGPSYRRGPEFFDPSSEATWMAYGNLRSQVQEATGQPRRDLTEWDLMPQSLRGMFDCRKITHVLVPVGEEPVIPWFTTGFRGTIATMELVRALERDGYRVQPRRGKGSHITLTAPGRLMMTIPANRRELSHVVLRSVAEGLNIPYRDLPAFVRT